MWMVTGLEFNAVSNDHTFINTARGNIELISGAVNGVYESYENKTRIESEWNQKSEYNCVLANDYYESNKLTQNKYLNNIKSIIESWNQTTHPGSTSRPLLSKLNQILNCTKLSQVLTHYGYYNTIIEIHKFMQLDDSKPTARNVIEAIAATEQLSLISLQFFQSKISLSNAFNMIIINNEYGCNNKILELIFFQLYGHMIVKPQQWTVRSSRTRSFHKAMFRKIQFYHQIDHLHDNHRIQHIIFGYFRKNEKLLPKHSAYFNVPVQAMYICWSYYNDYCSQIQSVQQTINNIPIARGHQMERFCSTARYQELKAQNKYFQKYYGTLYCDSYGSYQLEYKYKYNLLAILGYLMMSNEKCISQILSSVQDEWTLKSKLSAFYREQMMTKCYKINELKLKLLVKHLINCDENSIVSIGIEYVKDVYDCSKCGIKDIGHGSNIYVPTGGYIVHYIVAEMLVYVCRNELIEEEDIIAMIERNNRFPKCDKWQNKTTKQKCETAIIFHYVCSALGNSLYLRVLSLLKLSKICFTNKSYLIGWKCLIYGYKLCCLNGSIFPSFVNNSWYKSDAKFQKICKKLRCEHCGKRHKKLMPCSLCMKVNYCSKKCQKLHWQQIHGLLCDKSWDIVYEILKKRLFHRL